MSDERKEPESERAVRLQRAFDEAAGGMDLKLERCAGTEPRSVGVAFVFAALVPYQLEPTPPDANHDDENAIEELIERLETLTRAEYESGVWRTVLHDPYLSVGAGGVGVIDQPTINQWLTSPDFAEFQDEYPWKDPRDVKVKKVDVTFIGENRANATYRVTEKYANGATTTGNGAVTLVREANIGWRIIVVTKVSYDEH